MGSGISLSEKQLKHIIECEIRNEFEAKQSSLELYCDGYLIYRDFSDEIECEQKIREVRMYKQKKMIDEKE